MLSRALGGVAGSSRDKLLFALPGSTNAVELAINKLILPELKHLLTELRK
jgi:molybdenum cofactor biosynthesis protein B